MKKNKNNDINKNTDKNKSISAGLSPEKKKTLRRKRIIAVISFAIALGLMIWLGFFVTKSVLSLGEGENIGDAARHFKHMIRGYGHWGWLVAFGIQVLQVIVSPIPGQVVEIGMGITFGPFWSAVLCLVGAALASYIIMIVVRKFGVKFVELFISLDKLNDLKLINGEKKLERSVFILYILPGTPKDPLIFFYGLTKIKISDFVIISTLARAPTVFMTTLGGHLLQEKRYWEAAVLFVVLAVVSLACILLYKKILALLKSHSDKKANALSETPKDDNSDIGTQNEQTTGDDNNGTNDTEKL